MSENWIPASAGMTALGERESKPAIPYDLVRLKWIPAFAGMTAIGNATILLRSRAIAAGLHAMDAIAENISRMQERIAVACKRAGRQPEGVRLIAVSKTVAAERIREAYDAGLRDFGENRIQEAEAKRPELADLGITWHMIGHLQTNKTRTARDLFHWIHSVDSQRLAEKLDRTSGGSPGAKQAPIPVLIEVNLGGEAAKSGVQESDTLDLARRISALPTLSLRGLMTVPPFTDDPEGARAYFSRLRGLGKVVDSAHLPNVSMGELSMGMSHDFEVAIEEGATLVRIGTAIFGPRS